MNDARMAAHSHQTTAAVQITLEMLRRRVRDNQFAISADERISEAHAARLLEIHNDTLARRRQEGTGPIPYGVGLQGARVSYRLLDLALWIERHREKIDSKPA